MVDAVSNTSVPVAVHAVAVAARAPVSSHLVVVCPVPGVVLIIRKPGKQYFKQIKFMHAF